MDRIRRVLIVGGTHGNEFTGVYLVKKFEANPSLIQRSSVSTETLIGNPRAFAATRRYVEQDLNRSFSRGTLEAGPGDAYEADRARWIHQSFGSQGHSPADFVLDLHTSTASMGFTVILVNHSEFNLQLAAYLTTVNPDVRIYRWTDTNVESTFLNSICDRGFSIEVGPIAQGILNAALFEQTEQLIHALLDYLEQFNQNTLPVLPETVTLYQHSTTIDFPRNEQGELAAMIHPERQGKDYGELKPGDPIFLTFEGEAIAYTGESSVYPIFINEAAYYEKGVAMCLTKKETLRIKQNQ
jgi:aspartoacylase